MTRHELCLNYRITFVRNSHAVLLNNQPCDNVFMRFNPAQMPDAAAWSVGCLTMLHGK